MTRKEKIEYVGEEIMDMICQGGGDDETVRKKAETIVATLFPPRKRNGR